MKKTLEQHLEELELVDFDDTFEELERELDKLDFTEEDKARFAEMEKELQNLTFTEEDEAKFAQISKELDELSLDDLSIDFS